MGSSANTGYQLAKHIESVGSRLQSGGRLHVVGRLNVHPQANRDPFDCRLPPAGFDEDAGEFPLVDVEIVWPLEANRLRRKPVEGFGGNQSYTQRKHPESGGVFRSLDQSQPQSGASR